ncbi:hypothetical protein [Plantibacter flavus]|uniref:hypothetical protein n=1 Tax=Plantibacter flavus TaxID=150123 RepID=UPI00099D38C6|nr:hypothetical protein [Plantibacter flavus]
MDSASSGHTIFARSTLLEEGMRPRAITQAVRDGTIVRVRRDRYALPGVHDDIRAAVRIGGRRACLSTLAARGVFVFDATRVHVHVDRSASRLRGPRAEDRRLATSDRREFSLHWRPLDQPCGTFDCDVSIIDALAQSIRCQAPRMALATLDSAVHLGLVDEPDLRRVFALVPGRFRALMALIDGRAESGPETLLRLIVRSLGLSYEVQPRLAEGGRGDLLVAESLLIEVDSRAHHEGWSHAVSDRTRDLRAASRGLTTLRPLYQHVVYEPGLVAAAITGLIGEVRTTPAHRAGTSRAAR